jgi:hypothetical protein
VCSQKCYGPSQIRHDRANVLRLGLNLVMHKKGEAIWFVPQLQCSLRLRF